MNRKSADQLRALALDKGIKYPYLKKGIEEAYRVLKRYRYDFDISVLDSQLNVWRVVPYPHNGGINRFAQWWADYNIPLRVIFKLSSKEDMRTLKYFKCDIVYEDIKEAFRSAIKL